MARHVVHLGAAGVATPGAVGAELAIEGAEAEHLVKSKRLGTGEAVEAVDGAGVRLGCRVAGARKRVVTLEVVDRREEGPSRPEVEVWSASPKGQRLERMIDGLTQVGVSGWRPLETKLGVVEPGSGKLGRLRRVMVEAVKQSGRSWDLELGGGVGIGDVGAWAAGGGRVWVLEGGAGGEGGVAEGGHGRVLVLVGPEGGWTAGELDALERAGAVRVSLGETVLRVETAAVVGAGLARWAGT